MNDVFLGGTATGTDWRSEFQGYLDDLEISSFNPIVKDWNAEAQRREVEERTNCKVCFYAITPYMKGVYSIAEIIEDAIKKPDQTVFCLLANFGGKSFDEAQLRSLKAVGDMVERNGAYYCDNLENGVLIVDKIIHG